MLDAVQAALERQSGLVVGCCTGADEQVIRAAMMLGATHRLTILAAFGPQGEGAFELSAVDTVLKATALGADVRFFAGGPVEQPLDARLVAAHAGGHRRAPPRSWPSSAGPTHAAPTWPSGLQSLPACP